MKAPIATAITGTTISRMVRSRLRENFLRGALMASAPGAASATIFKLGSAIAFHVLRGLSRNCLLQIFAGDAELRKHGVDGLRIEAGEHFLGHLLDPFGDFFEQRPCRRSEVKPFGPP